MKKIMALLIAVLATLSATLVGMPSAQAEPFTPLPYPSGITHPHPQCGDYVSPTTGNTIHYGSKVPLNTSQMLDVAYTYGGFRGTTLRNMVTIAWGESNFCPRAFNNGAEKTPPTAERSYGLWQINAGTTAQWTELKNNCGTTLVTRDDLFYTDKNAKCAKFKLVQQGYGAWSAYDTSASWWAPAYANVDAWADYQSR